METIRALARAIGRALASFGGQEGASAEARPCPASHAGVLKSPLAKAHAALVMRNFDLRVGMRVLDVGCGIGRLSIPMARRVGPTGEVVALDLQEEMLAEVRRAAAAEGLDNVFTVQSAAGEALDVGLFDRVVLSSVLGEIEAERQVSTLQEIHRSLKPDGVVYVCEVTLFDPDYQTKDAVRALAWDTGFLLKAAHTVAPGYVLELTKVGSAGRILATA